MRVEVKDAYVIEQGKYFVEKEGLARYLQLKGMGRLGLLMELKKDFPDLRYKNFVGEWQKI